MVMRPEALKNCLITQIGRNHSSHFHPRDHLLIGTRTILQTQHATTWENVGTNIKTRFSNGRKKFRYRMEVEPCIRGDEKQIRKFLYRVKRLIDKGWPDNMIGIEAAQQITERDPQALEKRQTNIDYSLKRL